MALFGTLPTVRAQAAQWHWLQPAFAYLDELFTPGTAAHQKLQSLAAGETFRRGLPDGNFALEQVYLTHPRGPGGFETHRQHIDVQVILEGGELMEATHPGRLTVREAYAPDRDATFYHDAPFASVLCLHAGDAAVYFPDDAHNGGLQIAGPQLVRKVVVKVPVPRS
jgi:YhcH/YjgK/YiaL family protein